MPARNGQKVSRRKVGGLVFTYAHACETEFPPLSRETSSLECFRHSQRPPGPVGELIITEIRTIPKNRGTS